MKLSRYLKALTGIIASVLLPLLLVGCEPYAEVTFVLMKPLDRTSPLPISDQLSAQLKEVTLELTNAAGLTKSYTTPIIRVGRLYQTPPTRISQDKFTITSFVVRGQNQEAYYATPTSPSTLVTLPLGSPSLSLDTTRSYNPYDPYGSPPPRTMMLEVVQIAGHTVSEFSLKTDEPNTLLNNRGVAFAPLIQVKGLDPTTNAVGPLLASVQITGNNKTFYSGIPYWSTDRIFLGAPSVDEQTTMTLTASSIGYESKSITLTPEQLASYASTPLQVELTPLNLTPNPAPENSYIDVHSAFNNFDGAANAPNIPNYDAFAVLNKTDGSIRAWGNARGGGSGAPTDKGYIKIYPSSSAFAALKSDGSITAWGSSYSGGSGAPTDNGYTRIYSNYHTFAAIKSDGSITVWGGGYSGNECGVNDAPTDNGYTKISSTYCAFAALKADGSITAWGTPDVGGSGAPTDKGYVKIYSNGTAFAALKADGSIKSWGRWTPWQNWDGGTSSAPGDRGYTKIYSNRSAFAALKADGSIAAWGGRNQGGSGAPTDKGYVKIYPNGGAFVAVKANGAITAWGDTCQRGLPKNTVYKKIYTDNFSFAALKANDGSITHWDVNPIVNKVSTDTTHGVQSVITSRGFIDITASAEFGFAALKPDGSIKTWGGDLKLKNRYPGPPTDKGYIKIYSAGSSFAAVKADGSITTWGSPSYGGVGAPTGAGWSFE